MNDTVKKKVVSFSQFSNWFTCARKWKLDYIDKLKSFEDSLNMSFGTAIHETMQTYLTALYNESEEKANQIDMVKFMEDSFQREIKKKSIPHTKEEYDGFVEDGKNILQTFSQIDNRTKYFPTDKYSLLAIEDEINLDVKHNVQATARLDIVFKERMTGKIKIVDIKTSTNGWNNYQKEDFTKTSQLVLYKALYSKKYDIPLHMIDVEFFIIKRKLYENCNYPQSYIQIFKPKSAHADVVQVINEFSNFVGECFTPEGEYKKDIDYPKMPGKNKKNCKFCPHLKSKICDGVASVK